MTYLDDSNYARVEEMVLALVRDIQASLGKKYRMVLVLSSLMSFGYLCTT